MRNHLTAPAVRRWSRDLRRLAAAGLGLAGVEQMSDLRESVHRQPAGWSGPIEAGQVIGKLRHVYDVAGFRDERVLPFDLVADLACQDNPKFGAFGVIVPAITGLYRRQVL